MQKIKNILGSALLVLGIGLLLVPTTSLAKVSIDDANAENHKVACDKKGGTVDGSGNCSEGGSEYPVVFGWCSCGYYANCWRFSLCYK